MKGDVGHVVLAARTIPWLLERPGVLGVSVQHIAIRANWLCRDKQNEHL